MIQRHSAVVLSFVILLYILTALSSGCLLINCRLVYCLISTSMVIPTLLHCCLKPSPWMHLWSCLRSRYWFAGSTTISLIHLANGRCPISQRTSRILSSIFISWIRLLRRMLELLCRPRMYVDWLLNCQQ